MFSESNVFSRCVAKTDCRGDNPITKRTIGFGQCMDPAIIAADATCSETEKCCHESKIQRQCSDYR